LKKIEKKRRILIVGEGRETEYNYFVGFRRAFEKELEATSTSITVARGKGGNARNIVENAIKKAKQFQPDRKRGDSVFLLLDTEGVGRASELPAAEVLARKNGIEIVYSCPAFEYWLLCHFHHPSRGYFKDCNAVIEALDKDKHWNSVCKTEYDKADQDIFDRLSDLLDQARAHALEIDLHHLRTVKIARRTNPSTQVYELIAILIGARTGEKCPITGSWKLVGDVKFTKQISKGDELPSHEETVAHWKL
jgi:hypothetical protein